MKTNKIAEKVKKLKAEIATEIRNLPDNPKIHRIGKNTYTINVSDLSEDVKLSPRHYDFKRQYEEIIRLVERTNIKDVESRLDEIIRTGRWETMVFHPDVIKNLKRIWK